MRIVALCFLVVSTPIFSGCQSKATKVKQLPDQYNAEYPAWKECLDPETAGSPDLLTGKNLTQEQIATLEARKKTARGPLEATG